MCSASALGSLFGKAGFEPGLVPVLLPFEQEHASQAGLHQGPVCSWAFLPSSAQQQQLYRGSFEPLHNIFDPNALGQCQKCLFGGRSGDCAGIVLGAAAGGGRGGLPETPFLSQHPWLVEMGSSSCIFRPCQLPAAFGKRRKGFETFPFRACFERSFHHARVTPKENRISFTAAFVGTVRDGHAPELITK